MGGGEGGEGGEASVQALNWCELFCFFLSPLLCRISATAPTLATIRFCIPTKTIAASSSCGMSTHGQADNQNAGKGVISVVAYVCEGVGGGVTGVHKANTRVLALQVD